MKNFAREFQRAIAAGEALVHIKTDEIHDAIEAIALCCQQNNWRLRLWNKRNGMFQLARSKGGGIRPVGAAAARPTPARGQGRGAAILAELTEEAEAKKTHDLLGALEAVCSEPPEKDVAGADQPYIPVLTVCVNFTAGINERNREQLLATCQDLSDLKDEQDCGVGKFLVALTPFENGKLPPEIAPLFYVIRHDRPDAVELETIFNGVRADNDESAAVDPVERKRCVQAAKGLTRLQAEGIFAAALIDGGKSGPSAQFIWEQKADILNESGLVTLLKTTLSFKDVAGAEGKKQFLRKLLAPDDMDDDDPEVRAKGVCDVGVAGCGKSLMAQCCGKEFDMPVLEANPGNLMGGFVGDTERNTREFFSMVRSMSPCIVIVDEVNKVMPSHSSAGGDSGVGRRLLGTFLSEMQKLQEKVFWYFTENSIEDMHEAFTRAERIDAILFTGMPSAEERAACWKLYIEKFFPAQIKGKANPGHLKTELAAVRKDFEKVKNWREEEWAPKFAAALMCLPLDKRNGGDDCTSDEKLLTAIEAHIVDDEDWTQAEIRATCRLARRLKEPLHEAAKRVQHVGKGRKGKKMLDKLQTWAADCGALDSETGTIFVHPHEREAAEEPDDDGKPAKPRMRRRVRRHDED